MDELPPPLHLHLSMYTARPPPRPPLPLDEYEWWLFARRYYFIGGWRVEGRVGGAWPPT